MVYDARVSGFLKLLSSRIISSVRTQLQQDLNDLKIILET